MLRGYCPFFCMMAAFRRGGRWVELSAALCVGTELPRQGPDLSAVAAFFRPLRVIRIQFERMHPAVCEREIVWLPAPWNTTLCSGSCTIYSTRTCTAMTCSVVYTRRKIIYNKHATSVRQIWPAHPLAILTTDF